MAKEDLEPCRTKAEAKKRGKAGGVASGKARREKRAMRETLSILLSMPVKTGQNASIDDVKSFATLKGKNITVQDAITIAMMQKALKGDVRAAEWIRDTSGNKLKDAVELSGGVNNPFAGMSTDELKKLIGDD